MKWSEIIVSTVSPPTRLSQAVEELLSFQRENWSLFRQGELSLAAMSTKTIYSDGASVLVQANPRRKISTHARVDPASVAKRPCFLCPTNMPAGERGLAWGELVLLPNPYPVLPRHLTIPLRAHRPQRLRGQIELLLTLSRALGKDTMVFYNGPACGASAPDHFHFQACTTSGVPLLAELPRQGKMALTSFGRRLLFYGHSRREAVAEFIDNVLDLLPAAEPEPLLNVLAMFQEGIYKTVIWPRAKHRPECFFAEGEKHIAVSPAALEAAGVMVVAEPAHIERIDADTIASIYREVSLDQAEFDKLARAVT